MVTTQSPPDVERIDRLAARRNDPPLFRLRGRAHKAALTAHVLTSVGWFGVAGVVLLCALAAAASDRATEATGFYRTMALAPWLSIPLGLGSVATGVLLGLGTSHGVIRRWWVVIKIAISVAVIVTDAFVVRHFAEVAVGAGHASRALRDASIAHVVALAVATVLSVFKPGGTTPWAPRRSSATSPVRR
jgi:hypothetical protein